MTAKPEFKDNLDDQLIRDIAECISDTPPDQMTADEKLAARQAMTGLSSQTNLIRTFLGTHIRKLAKTIGRPVSVASIGCGTGELDYKLIGNLKDQISFYLGIDQYEENIEAFSRLAGDDSRFSLECEDFMLTRIHIEFDVMFAANFLNTFADISAFIDKMRRINREDGICIFATAPDNALNNLFCMFQEHKGLAPLFSESLCKSLDGHGVSYEKYTLPCRIPVTKIDKSTLDGLMQIKTSSLSEQCLEKIHQYLEQAAYQTPDDPALDNSVDMVLIR